MNDQEFYEEWVDQLAAIVRFREWTNAIISEEHFFWDRDREPFKFALENLRDRIRWYKALSNEERMKLTGATTEYNRLVALLIELIESAFDKEALAWPTRARRAFSLIMIAFNAHYTISAREREILILRYGLEDGHARTLKEVARVFNITPERLRQIELEVLSKLKRCLHHPLELDADRTLDEW